MKLRNLARAKLPADASGAVAVEYMLLLATLVFALVLAVAVLGPHLQTGLVRLANNLQYDSHQGSSSRSDSGGADTTSAASVASAALDNQTASGGSSTQGGTSGYQDPTPDNSANTAPQISHESNFDPSVIPADGTLIGSGKYKGECVVLVQEYRKDIASLGSVGSAKNMINVVKEKSDLYVSPDTPSRGAAMVFDAWEGNQYGHVGIVDSYTLNADGTYTITLIHQNFPLGSGSHKDNFTFDPTTKQASLGGNSKYTVLGFIY